LCMACGTVQTPGNVALDDCAPTEEMIEIANKRISPDR